jgi:TolB protein
MSLAGETSLLYDAGMNKVNFVLLTLFLSVLTLTTALAQRDPVLKQIDVPHSYYYREMYLPQLTSGPSTVSWTPDSRSLVYSMQGSLWKQGIDGTVAQQLTWSAGYDYQPDVSRNGKWVVFSRYLRDAVELFLLDLSTAKEQQLTTEGAVNVDARWSPDGKKIAFVSTRTNGHFHVFTMTFTDGKRGPIVQLMDERKSNVARYYYSPFDHELSPTWSPDSSELIVVSNPETIYGTGGFYRLKAEPGSEAKRIHYEETTWKAHPDWSPDGKRLVYSSYLGRAWHQLWVLPANGGDPFPLTYGEFDNTCPRWSPDGTRIAFVSNKGGNTSLWTQEVLGGAQKQIRIPEKRYLRPVAQLDLTILSPAGKPVAARVSITDADGRMYAPDESWIHSDDSFVRSERAFEAQYFHTTGKSTITVPAAKLKVDVLKGFEHEFEQDAIEIKANGRRQLTVKLRPLSVPKNWGTWVNGDLHVHMNYGGAYRNTPEHLAVQASAENLQVVNNLIVNKEQRIPDIAYFSTKPDPASTADVHILHAQEFHTSFWGHLGLLNLKDHYLIPDYSSYSNTAAASPQPTNAVIADLTHAQGGLVGYVHPFDSEPEPGKVERELPIDVALGKVDYYEVMGFSDHKISASVWYRLLNCGFKLAAGAGTDAMANFASLRGPVGDVRVYVKMDGPFDVDRWMTNLRNARTFVTNGPLLHFTVNNHLSGDEIRLPAGQQKLNLKAGLRSFVPLDHLQVIFNGDVVQEIPVKNGGKLADFEGVVNVDRSGWLVLRAWRDQPTYPILDLYPYASTSPVYITVGNAPVHSQKDAEYFIGWIDELLEDVKARTDYNTEAEKEQTIRTLTDARKIYEKEF